MTLPIPLTLRHSHRSARPAPRVPVSIYLGIQLFSETETKTEIGNYLTG